MKSDLSIDLLPILIYLGKTTYYNVISAYNRPTKSENSNFNDMKRTIIDYVTRNWDDEPNKPPHPLIKILPPFVWELLSYILGLAILFQLFDYYLF